jgi:ActR/RegA family two-component response regulator
MRKMTNQDYLSRPIEVDDIARRHLDATDTKSITRLLTAILGTLNSEQLLQVYEELTGDTTIEEMGDGGRYEWVTKRLTK